MNKENVIELLKDNGRLEHSMIDGGQYVINDSVAIPISFELYSLVINEPNVICIGIREYSSYFRSSVLIHKYK